MAKNKDQVHFKGGLGIVTVPSSASKMATPKFRSLSLFSLYCSGIFIPFATSLYALFAPNTQHAIGRETPKS